MNGSEHKQIGSKAVKYLSGEAREYWRAVTPLLEDSSVFPDVFWSGYKAPQKYLDQYSDWRDYIMIPIGEELINCHSAFDTLRLEETYPTVLEFLLNSCVKAMKANQKELAAKFAGVLSHIIGDTGQAAHVCDPAILAPLFQKENECYLIHTFIEAKPEISFPDELQYSARSLGNSLPEVCWRLLKELQHLKKHGMGMIVPIMVAGQKNDWKTAGIYATQMVVESTCLFADLLESLYLLVTNKPIPTSAVSLIELEPDNYHCDGMFNFMPQKNHMPGDNPISPLALDIGNGIQAGYALLPDMFPGCAKARIAYIDFTIPAGVFETLVFSCGLNRNARRNETKAVFEVFCDNKKNWKSAPIGVADPPVTAEINLKHTTHLRLQVKDARKDALETKFFYPCYIEPLLQRPELTYDPNSVNKAH
ncbi:MAG: NPCBM/NEW2 domain-containing protein [Victivallales bacterium]|jgi:hypothetical protein|nr:NPCBM/NEW2 domain-containing protein [Victivallales bacterium]